MPQTDPSSSQTTSSTAVASTSSSKPELAALYNNKGGVGKTTAVLNFGYLSSSRLNLRVLMVDMDPQANLTGLIEAENFESLTGSSPFYEQCATRSRDARKHITVADIFSPLMGETINATALTMARASDVEITQVHDYPNLFYIPGHLKIGDIEETLGMGIGGVPMQAAFLLYVTDLLRKIAELNHIQLVIFDLNPSSSASNKAILGGVDSIIIPFTPDIFSLQAMEALSTLLPSINRKLQPQRQAINRPTEYHNILPPVILGPFPQKTRTRTDKDHIKQPEQAYGEWIQKIYERFQRDEQTFREAGLLAPTYEFHSLGGLKDLVKVGLDVQHSGRPVSDLDFPHLHYISRNKTRNLGPKEKDRKKEAHASYLKIIGTLFLNMRAADLAQLGIQQDLAHWASLAEGSVQPPEGSVQPPEASVQPPEASVQPPEAMQNEPLEQEDLSPYDDDKIRRLMEHYFNPPEVVFTVALPLSNRDSLETTIRIVQEKLTDLRQSRTMPHYLLIPLCIGENPQLGHWVILIIFAPLLTRTPEEQQSFPWLFYFDPAGTPPSDLIKHLIDRTCDNTSENIMSLDRRTQEDNYNCGPWIIEGARAIISGHQIPTAAELNINEKRREHNSHLRPPASTPRRRQRELEPATRAHRARRAAQPDDTDLVSTQQPLSYPTPPSLSRSSASFSQDDTARRTPANTNLVSTGQPIPPTPPSTSRVARFFPQASSSNQTTPQQGRARSALQH